LLLHIVGEFTESLLAWSELLLLFPHGIRTVSPFRRSARDCEGRRVFEDIAGD